MKDQEIPAEVTRVAGCDCGGLDYHRGFDQYGSGTACSIWSLDHETVMANVEDAHQRMRAYVDALNKGPRCG